MRSGRFVFTKFAILPDHFFAQCDAGWIAGINEEERLDVGIFQLFQLSIRELKAVLLRGLYW